MLTTRWSSHFPRFSRANSAVAHDPRPSLSSVRETVKSHSKFPSYSQSSHNATLYSYFVPLYLSWACVFGPPIRRLL